MAAKKASAKSVKKTPVKAAPKKLPVIKDPLTKSGIYEAIRELTSIAKKDIAAVIEALGNIIELHIKSRGPGKFTMPGLLKIQVVNKPAKKARKGTNPFTGEEMMFKAQPARRVVKAKPLKRLKEMAT